MRKFLVVTNPVGVSLETVWLEASKANVVEDMREMIRRYRPWQGTDLSPVTQ